MRLATLLLALLLAAPALAQHTGKALPAPADRPALRGGDACARGTADAELAFGGVRARLFNKGNLYFDGGDPHYEVPKGSGIHSIFASTIWVAGLVNGELRTAAATYAQGGADYELYPGPLDAEGNPPDDCEPYDRIWRVDVREVEHYEATGEATDDLLSWPVELGAPVIDGDGVEGNYDLEGGDRPEVYGHETAFWVMNDVAGPHRSTLSEPIGLEVRVTAFAVAEADRDFHFATFYRYELVYRGDAPLEDAYFTFWTDPDLGNFNDDYVGTDSTRGMGFVYNADNDDEGGGGYGLNPPALGIDLLSAAGFTMWYFGDNNSRTGDPDTAEDFYNYMQAQWMDGSPLTEGGTGTDPDGTPIDYLFPGDPVIPTYWSERCPTPDCSSPVASADRRFHISTPSFTLTPGETKTVDVAVLWARGDDHLDSVTELRAASDAVQARYDDGALFAPFPPPPALPAPDLLAPEDGAFFVEHPPTLAWTPVPGADLYAVKLTSGAGTRTVFTEATSLSAYDLLVPPNVVAPVTWQVRAEDDEDVGAYSELRTFEFYQYAFDFFGDGDGVVETTYPGTEVCPDEGDPGCSEYGGNTVYLDPNATGDYVLTSATTLEQLVQVDVIGDDDFELRFTEACAAFGGCLGAYVRDAGEIVSVPFELWNIGDEDDPADDVRMIPLIRTNADNNPLTDWSDTFTEEADLTVDGETITVGVTDRIFFMMPDRPDGYALFEEAANGFGGPGALYDPENDGDTQVDTTATGNECVRQGWYIDFCYRSEPPFRSPIGGAGFAGLQVGDLAGDGTTPPAGTTIRFVTVDRLFEVPAEEDAPTAPETFALEAAYPNPFRASATVTYRLDAATDVRLAVYDVLGRRVAVLAEGPQAAGAHRARFEASGLASGVYLVVLEAGGQRQTQKVMLVR